MGFQFSVLETLKTSILLNILLVFSFNVKTGGGQRGIFIKQDIQDYYDIQSNFRGLRYSIYGSRYLTYAWYHNDTLINELYTLMFLGFRSDNLQVFPEDVDQRYQGTYQLFINSPFGNIFGRKIRVQFKVFGSFVSHVKEEKRQVIIGQSYSLKCPKHSYSTDCLYKWGLRSPATGLNHIKDTENRVILGDGTLFFSSITEQDLRDFSDGVNCILECTWCTAAKLSHRILLYSRQENRSNFGPKMITTLGKREVLLGTAFLTITCAAAGSPAPNYRWIKIVNGVTEENVHQTKDVHLGPFNHFLTFHNITKKHNGTYACIVSSSSNEERVEGNVIVREKPMWSPDGIIFSQSLNVFTNLTWRCKATGDPKPIYTWYANATRLSTKSGRYEINGGEITFSRLLVEDTGMYQCVAENTFGYIYQTVALYIQAQEPRFTRINKSEVLLIRNEGVLTCQSDAIPSAKHSWFKDGEQIVFTLDGKYALRAKHDLVIKKVTHEDAGIYKCVATNVFGRGEQRTNVTIGDIHFDITPKNIKDIGYGETFSLFCKAKSYFQIKYKWRLDNTELLYDNRRIWSVQSNRLVIQYANESDSGIYECVAYIDSPARVESARKAYVTVEGPPRALRGFHLQENCTNSSAVLVWEPLTIYNFTETYVIIEFRTPYDPPNTWHRSMQQKVNASLGNAQVTNLTAWAKIQFRAITVNNFGFGLPSKRTYVEHCQTLPAVPDKCPENFHGIPGSLEIVIIKWETLKRADFNGPGFNYILKYRRFGTPTWKNVTLGETEDHFTIFNAGVDKLWFFKIQTSNNMGPGPVCLEKSTYSGKAKPVSLLSLTVEDIQATSALVTWSAQRGKGHIDGFKLEYWRTEQTRNKREVTANDCGTHINPCRDEINGDANEYRISSLVPLAYHNVTLKAYNNIGDGPTKYATFQTVGLIGARRATPTYQRSWFITVISLTCFLVIAVLIIFLLRTRGERYPVRKRERAKGGLPNVEEFPDPSEDIYINHVSYPSSTQNLGEPDVEEDSNSVFLNDNYEDDGSFIGEYSNTAPARKMVERFV